MATRGQVNPNIRNQILMHQVDLTRLEAGQRQRVMRLLDRMLIEINGEMIQRDITRFNKTRLNQLLHSATDTIDRYYERAQAMLDTTLQGVADVQAQHTAKVLKDTFVGIDLSASIPTEAALAKIASSAIIMGAPSEEWWARQSRDTAFRFSNAVRQGMIAGDTTEQIVNRVAGRAGYPGVMKVSKNNARSLVHNSIMEVSNEARMATFKANKDVVKGFRQISTLDSHTTEVCIAYDGAEFDLAGKPINGTMLPYLGGCPRHWGCRSIEVPLTLTFKELGLNIKEPDEGMRASSEGPVPARFTFEEFLDTMSKEQQDEILGVGRAQLWRRGDITLQQLLDQKGNTLTLDQLRAKYA
jgi:hypothetical protein